MLPGGPGGPGGLRPAPLSGGRVLAPMAARAMVTVSEIPLRADYTAAAIRELLIEKRWSRFGLAWMAALAIWL